MLGISTACFFPLETEKTLPIIHDLGFLCIEAFLQAEYEYRPDYIKDFKAQADAYGIAINSVHSFCRVYEPYVFSDYGRRRADSLRVFDQVARAAGLLGACYYTFHGNLAEQTTEDFDYRGFADIMRELCLRCLDQGVFLAWENVAWCQSKSPDFIRRTLEYLDPGLLKFTLDFKQAKRAGVPVDDYIAVMGENIATVHINDSDEEHTCLLPGFGNMDYSSVVSLLRNVGYDGNYIVEVYPSDYKNIEELAVSRELLDNLKIFDREN